MPNLEPLTMKVSRETAEAALQFFKANSSEVIIGIGAKAFLEILGAFGASVYAHE